ncbi:MSHA biogenesis protein MshI [Photobacterium sanctipauli]|uniref:MSHA biogenesis protein MshI n=2 Tax=Photobacterium sanctipauli TaxID=1342794 RepID=A0A2T3N9M6_9GAMM|nr:MSHA biogenesis protein MshI [Photobacterium sanctipauli]
MAEKEWITDELAVFGANGWGDAIKELIERHQLKGYGFRLVLGHGFYQSMFIEKAELPREEYSTALPYLVKELVNESPTDLVADGFAAPLKDRLQVFVSHRKQLELLIAVFRESGCDLMRVSAEEVVWGQLTTHNQNQLVLHRRGSGNLQLSAYRQQVLCFQRQLRGFTAPLLAIDGGDGASGELQLDGLALELQRSLDFLSAQLRDAPITQLLISCDDDNDQALAQALGQRLNVNVVAVSPSHPSLTSNAARVAHAGVIEPEQAGINFYSDALKPSTNLLTLPNIVMSWLAIAIVMASMAGWFAWQNYHQQQQLAAEQARLAAKSAELERAKASLAKHLPSPLKIEAADGLEQHLAAKKATLKAIAEHDDSLQVGYANMLQQLSDAADGDISLQRIAVSGKRLNLEGLARSPAAVPTWLKAFKTHPDLSGRRFQLMSLGRNDKNIVTFKLLAEREQNAQGETP